eukprot:gi/632946768/ref/XP_007888721.1/ PREDICTED: protein FAM208A isoform X3 [Callorhinchus milii]
MIHNDKLEKEFTEKRKELRTEGRTEKELAELYAFLLVDPSEASIICDKGLAVGKSKVTILGNPAMGVYLSKYSDILQPNPLDTGKQADIIIFKIIKGRVKAVFDNPTKNFTPPTPKHDCHVSKNLNRVTSLFTYRAFDITQFYLYEIGSEGVRQIPRHVCPYAVVSFVYKEDKIPKTPKSAVFSMDDIQSGKSHYTVWKGQLVNKGRFFCFGSLRAASQPFLPMKLPEKLDVETVMSIDCLKTKVPAAVFHKNTFCGLREALRNGLYYSLYEFVERGKTGSNLEALLHKLEEDKQVLIKPLGDQGFLLLFSPSEMAGNDEFQGSKSKFLQALFLFPKPRMMSSVEETERHAETTAVPHIGPEALPELSTLVPALHFALDRIRKELPNSLQKTTMDVAFENNLMGYLNCSGKEASAENGKPKFTLPPYEERRFSTVRQKRPNVHRILRSYFFNPFHYQFDVSKALEMLEHHPNREAKIPSPPLECSGDKQKLEPQPAPEEPINSTVTSSMADYNFMIPSVNIADYDPDKIQELIDLIHTRKRHRPGEPSGVNIEGLAHCISDKNNLGLKRKLVCVTERSHKRMKTTQGGPFSGLLGDSESLRLSDLSPEETNGLVSSDTVLRQSDATTSLAPDTQKLVGLLLEVLKSTSSQTPGTGAHLKQDIRMSVCSSSDDVSRNAADYCWDQNNLLLHKETQKNNDDPTSQNEALTQKLSEAGFPSSLNPESPRLFESDSCPTYPDNIHFRTQTNEQPSGENVSQHNMRAEYPEEQSLESAGSVDACSPCTNASLEQLYSRKPSTPESGSENEINWKLVPITHMKSRNEQLFYLPPEDSCPVDPRVIIRQIDINHYHSPSNSQAGAGSVSNEYVPDLQNDDPDPTVYETNGHLSASKDSSASVIENMVLLEYNTFANKMRQLLKKEKVRYSAEKKQPTFSTPSKVPSLSRFASVCTRDVAVQNYVSQLRKKMNCVVADACSHRSFKNVCLNPTSPKDLAQTVQNRTAASSTIVQDLDASTSSRLQTLKPTAEEAVNNTGGTYDGQTCSEKTREPEKDPKSDSLKPIPSQLTSGLSSVGLQEVSGMTDLPKARPCITNLIQQLKPEMFCSLVKIIKDVQKNTVKFYVSEVEETSSVCAEIKEYLTGLGNKECHPNQFLKDGCMDKLLIIIQNEDIAAHIHKIPLLMSLKKLSSVSFAGVESLDDVQNHTYNELFVSGGFVVSDETVLNLKSVTIEKLQMFLKFLEDLSSPESKWLWKIHCKIYKRLKEQARTNTAALNILSLLNKYQKCNVVEVLSYHDCDSRARNTIELECLVKLQAQNIQHRHVVFLTEKNLETLPSYSQCGVVVACVEDFVNNFRSLIGYHSSSVENKQLRVESQENLQAEAESADAENLVTSEGNHDEEDMSLDSEDDSPRIEICSEESEDVYVADSSHIEVHGTERNPSQPEEELPSGEANVAPSSELDFNNVQLNVAASTSQIRDSRKGTKAEECMYKSSLFYPHLQIESDYRNFNVMTHQSFLTSGIKPSYVASLNHNNQDPSKFCLPGYSHNMVYNENDKMTSSWDHSWSMASESPLTYQQQQQKQQY